VQRDHVDRSGALMEAVDILRDEGKLGHQGLHSRQRAMPGSARWRGSNSPLTTASSGRMTARSSQRWRAPSSQMAQNAL
jgi:hypothetical protein